MISQNKKKKNQEKWFSYKSLWRGKERDFYIIIWHDMVNFNSQKTVPSPFFSSWVGLAHLGIQIQLQRYQKRWLPIWWLANHYKFEKVLQIWNYFYNCYFLQIFYKNYIYKHNPTLSTPKIFGQDWSTIKLNSL